ncbi:MAG: zf-HC2 domain-containing protein [Planctomycetota bacterium]
MTNTLDCADIRALLSGLVDDEVDGETRHLAERHFGDCRRCRQLMDETELLHEQIGAHVDAMEAEIGLPAGFEDAVLQRIADEDDARMVLPTRSRSWLSWTGWAAAAAALVFSFMVWRGTNTTVETTPVSSDGALALGNDDQRDELVAVHIDEAIDDASSDRDEQLVAYAGPPTLLSPANAATSSATMVGTVEALTAPADVERIAPSPDATALVARQKPEVIRGIDADAIGAASWALRQVLEAREDTFMDIERVRSFIRYDEIVPRLTEVRSQIAPAERPAVYAVESVLVSIEQGPLSMQDVRELKTLVGSMDLVERLESMSQRYDAANVL